MHNETVHQMSFARWKLTFALPIQSAGWDGSLLGAVAELAFGAAAGQRWNAGVVGDVLDWVGSKNESSFTQTSRLEKQLCSPSVCPNRSTFTVQHARRRRSKGKCNLTPLVSSLRLEALIALEILAQNVFASLLLRLPNGLLSLLDLATLLAVTRLHIVDALATLLVFLFAELLSGQSLRLQLLQLLLSLLILFLFQLLYSFFAFLLCQWVIWWRGTKEIKAEKGLSRHIIVIDCLTTLVINVS